MITALLAATLAVAPVQRMDTTISVRSGARLTVDNMSGTVVVRSWDRNEMRVQASERRYVEIDALGSRVSVESDARRGMPQSLEFDITVPREFDVDIEGINLGVQVEGVTGDVTVETVNGSISLSGLNGRINAEAVHGGLTVRDSRGELEAQNSNGPIMIENHDGDIMAEGINGGITMSGMRSGNVEAETVNGAISYSGQIRDNGRYIFSTHIGGVTLFVPEGTNAAVSIETWNGQVEADFPIEIRNFGRREEMTFTLGNGGSRIEIETFGGQVRLRRPGGR